MGLILSLTLACAVCGAADKTLPTNGAETPFDGRKRATLELRAASFETNDRVLGVTELRAEPGFAMAVTRDVIVGAELPILERSLRRDDETRNTELGDAEVRATFTAWRGDRSRVLLTTALKLPTAKSERDPSGALVPPDLQPGCGSLVPVLDARYVWTQTIWSVWASASLVFPISIRAEAHPGDSLRSSLGIQVQPLVHFAARVSVSGRLDGTGELEGETVRASGGAAVFVAPEVIFNPYSDVVLGVGASFPVVQEMRAYKTTAPVMMASAGVDF